MMDFCIPHTDLTPEEKRACMEIMAAGNGLMKAWAEDFYGKKNKASRLRRGLFKWVSDPTDPDALDPHEAGIPPSVLAVMLRVREIESKLMFGHVKMVVRLARRFRWAMEITYLDFDDLLLEGFIALRDAIYTYDKPAMAGFITYAHLAIRRRFRRKINKASDFGGFSEKGFKLLEKYNVTRRRLEEKMGTVQMDTVFLAMNVSEEDESHLRSMLKRCIRASAMQMPDSEGNAYEQLGQKVEVRDIDLSLLVEAMNRDGILPIQQDVVVAAAQGSLEYEEVANIATASKGKRINREQMELMMAARRLGRRFWDAVQQADLCPMELELVEAAAKGEKNFRSRIASKHINPETDKPYSRMSATNMLRRAYKTVKRGLRVRETVAA